MLGPVWLGGWEKLGDSNKILFSLVCLVGRMKMWRDGKLFCLVEKKKNERIEKIVCINLLSCSYCIKKKKFIRNKKNLHGG